MNNLKSKMKSLNIDIKGDQLKIIELEKENKELRDSIENENNKNKNGWGPSQLYSTVQQVCSER